MQLGWLPRRGILVTTQTGLVFRTLSGDRLFELRDMEAARLGTLGPVIEDEEGFHYRIDVEARLLRPDPPDKTVVTLSQGVRLIHLPQRTPHGSWEVIGRGGHTLFSLPKRLVPQISSDRSLVSAYDGIVRRRHEEMYDVLRGSTHRLPRGCFAAARVPPGVVLSCATSEGGADRADLMLWSARGTRLIAEAPYTVPHIGAVGHWVSVMPSPDGETLLAQWSGECEVPEAFLVSLEDRRTRPLVPHRRGAAPNSTALGWGEDDTALALVPEDGACGGGMDGGGVYAFETQGGTRRLVFAIANGGSVVRWGRG